MKLIKKIMRVIGFIVVIFLFILAIVLFLPVLLPLVIFGRVKESISLRAFRHREAGRVYLICTSRRNWRDFLRNNVIPVLPDNFRVVWDKPRKPIDRWLFRHFDHSRIFGVPKPYLVAVTRRALVHRSLNSVLQKLKAHPKKSEEVRRASAEILAEIEAQLQKVN